MKRIQIYILLMLVFFTIFSCKKEYEAPGPAANNIFVVVPRTSTQIHEALYFGDLSSGVKSRSWTFPSQYVDILDSDNDRTSDLSTVAARFSEPGTYEVSISIEFEDKLLDDGIYSGRTKFDTSLTVYIQDSVQALFRANFVDIHGEDSTELDLNSVNDLWGGEYIRYTSLRYGGPTDYGWYFEGGNPESYIGTDSAVTVQYPGLGTFGIMHAAWRTDPTSADSAMIAQLVEVVPSERPAVLVEAWKIDRNTIELTFSQYLDDPTEQVDNVTLSALNSLVYYPVNVASLALHSTEPNKVIVTLDAEVYDNDTITISYTPGDWANAYEGVVAQFTNFPVEPVLESALPDDYDSSFEDPAGWADGGMTPTDIYSSFHYLVGPEEARTGNNSLYMACQLQTDEDEGPGGGSVIHTSMLTFEEGVTYRLGAWCYSDNPGSLPGSFAGVSLWINTWNQIHSPSISLENAMDENWTRFHLDISPGELETLLYVRGYSAYSTLDISFYLDDIFLYRLDVRPE